MARLALLTSLSCLLLPPALVRADGGFHDLDGPAPRLVSPSTPWVFSVGPEVGDSMLEQVYGIDLPADQLPETRRIDDMVIDADTLATEDLLGLGLTPPLPGLAQPETPGVLVLEMSGVTLRPFCGNGESANGALNCSPLVDTEVVFPAINGANHASILQEVRGYMAPFNLVVAGNRPLDFVPYTLAVVGGSSSNAGFGGGTCGVANVSCDGLKRNHVSLTFESCGSSLIPDIIAQETSHNWGLEHVNNTTDLLYPSANGGFKEYVDQCMTIVENDGVTQCGHVHEFYCPNGGGSQQNSFAEMMGVFGPAAPDEAPPEIVSVTPADGSTFDPEESFTVSAQIAEDSNFAGIKWTWLEGVPDAIANDQGTLTKCTNKVCDQDFGAFIDPNSQPWDFIKVGPGIPEGTYTFKVEVMDQVGGYDSREITITVGDGLGGSGSDTDSDSGDSGTDSGSGGTDSGTDSGVDTLTGGLTAGDGTDEDGCGCRGGTPPGGAASLALLSILAWPRRRR